MRGTLYNLHNDRRNIGLILNFTQFHSLKKDIRVPLLAQADHLLKLINVTNEAGCIQV